MSQLTDIYNIEHPVQKAFALVFGARNIAIYTPSNDGFADDAWVAANPELAQYVLPMVVAQKKRPRIELLARIGAAQGRHYAESEDIQPIGGYCHDFARALSVGLKCVTGTNILEHYAYVAEVRGVMATILRTINGDTTPDVPGPAGSQLTIHRIPELSEAGTTNAYKSEEGYFVTDIIYSGHLTIQADALQAL